MKKVIIFSLLFVLSACSYDSSKVKTIVSQVKNDGVEHLKKELKLWTQKEEEQAPEQEVKNTPETKQYINEKIGFSFSYPGDIVLGQEVQTDTFVLDVKIKNIETDNVQGLSRDDLLIMSRNIEKGEFGDVSGWTLDNSKKIYRINDKIVEEGVVFSKVGVCSVVFERNLVFFEGNNLINIKLIADSSDIINENSTFFRSDKTNCGDSQVWIFARQGEFYSNLLQNKIGGTAQAWFNSFESIKNSLKIEESLEKTGLSQSVNIKQVNLSPGESGLKLIWPEISGIKQEEAYKKIVESLDFVENTGKTLEQVERNYKNCHCGLVGSSYAINYRKNNILGLSLVLTYKDSGARKVREERYNYIFDLNTGEKLNIQDLIKPDKINDLLKIINQKLQENIKIAKNKDNFSDFKGEFDKDNLDNFLLSEKGIQFFYNFSEIIPELKKFSFIFVSFDEFGKNNFLFNI